MPQEDGRTDLSEMRSPMDTQQDGTAEDVSVLQDYAMGDETDEKDSQYGEAEVNPEDAKYRVMMADIGCVQNETLYLDYFSDYTYANMIFDSICDDTEFVKYHDRNSVEVVLQKAYRGLGQIFWETIRKSVVYDTSKN